MRDRIKPYLAPAFGLIVFAAALWALHHALRHYRYHDIVNAVKAIPRVQLGKAVVCAICSYVFLTLHDVLAFRYAGRSLSYPRVAFASFVGYSISNSVGFSFLSGGSIRYRLYSGWTLSAGEITRIAAFCTITGWLGFGTLAGASLVIEPSLLAHTSIGHPAILRTAGVIMLVAVGAYLAACAAHVRPMRVRGWEFSLPSFRLGLAQIAVSAVDHGFVVAALYLLLPADRAISYPAFVGVFMMSLAAGMMSQVPGGAGVFETLTITLLAPVVSPANAMAALIAYRAIYYLGPLFTGIVLIIVHELRRRRALARRFVQSLDPWLSPIVPQVLAFATLINGAILLFSGATPAVHGRIEILRDLLPLPIVEISHFLASVTGALLVLLARSLQRRVDAAFLLTLGLLGAGGCFSLLKGIDYEEAVISFSLLAILAPCRRYFYRKASLLENRFSPGWAIAVVLVFCCAAWLTLFAYEHVQYSDELWWKFSFRGDVHRSLRAIVGAAASMLLFAAAQLLRPARPEPVLPACADIDSVMPIIDASPSTMGALALLGDKALLINDSHNAFIMYRVEGRSWIALGDPIGPVEEWIELIWRYREISDRHSGWTVFYQVAATSVHYYLDLGLVPLKLGEEAHVDLASFSLDGGGRKAERSALHKLEKEGATFDVVPQCDVSSVLAELREVSDRWLAEKNAREKGFSIGYFSEPYLRRFPQAVVRIDGRICAFANLFGGANRMEASIDLMRYDNAAPSGVMDFLLIHAMLWAKDNGYRSFNLGMAPLSGLDDRPLAPAWNRFSALLYRHGEHFYNFQGLRRYKQKFGPQWHARYLLSPGGLALPTILTNLTSLISRGLAGAVHK